MNNNRGRVLRIVSVFGGVAINVLLGYMAYSLEIPLYLDTIGTIAVAMLCGAFPGFMVAVITNVICCLFNDMSAYYAILNVLIAWVTADFVHRGWQNKKRHFLLLIAAYALIGGGLGSLLQLVLLGQPQFQAVSASCDLISETSGINFYVVFFGMNIFLNLIDKGLSALVVITALRLVPIKYRYEIWNGAWKQKPLSSEEIEKLKKERTKGRTSIESRISRLIGATAIIMAFIMVVISVRLYSNKAKSEYEANAIGAVKLAALEIKPYMVDSYLRDGEAVPDYEVTEEKLYAIREGFRGVEYLYALKIEEDGGHFIFDLDTDGVEGYEPGEVVPFDEEFYPYLEDLYAGKSIEPIVNDSVFGWLLTVYEPVKDEYGHTVCYVGADVSMEYLSDYVKSFLLKAVLVFSGFFVLILGYGLWTASVYLIYPINSMATCTNTFIYNGDNQAALDDNVKKIRELNIHTGDELEDLYNALCKMTRNTAEQMKDIRHQTKAINQMQTGLIITMADLVENRDADTGYHIQKTADYVKIILKGLKRKGYYANKMTPKYMSDVEMSAPLHDIGKVSIPDAVLNKPGKLTDEEYEIMKTHTTAGKNIMEKAISTVQGDNYLKEARNMAGYHHEKWDGTGYPEGLKGEVIPLSARIMAVADVFDALTARRVYKDPMPFEKAMSIIVEGSGKHFDPKCVEVFVEAEDEVKRVLKKYQEF